MYGPLSKVFYLSGYKLGSKFWVLPYRWCPKSKELHVNPGKPRLYIWYFQILVDLSVFLWSLVRAIQSSKSAFESKKSTIYFLISVAFTFISMFPLLLQGNTYRLREELPLTHFQYLCYVKHAKDKYLTPEKLNEPMRKDKVGLICLLLAITGLGFFAQVLLIIWMYPKLPVLPSSLFNLPQPAAFAFAAVQQMLLSYYFLRSATVIVLYAFPALEALSSGVYLVSEARYGIQSTGTNGNLRTEKEFIKFRRELQLMFSSVASVYCPLVVPGIKIILLLLAVFAIYGTLKLPGLFGMTSAVGVVILTSFLVYISRLGAEIPEISDDATRSWKKSKHSPELQRFVKSLSPLKIPVGSFYFVDRDMILKMLKFIVETTVDMFILF